MKDEQKDIPDDDKEGGEVELTKHNDEEAPPPPPLERTQARQISRVGAMAIAGIGVTRQESASSVRDVEDHSTCADTQHPSTSTLCTDDTTINGGESLPNAVNVTATLVSDDEYEAELHRVIMKTAVHASSVEASPEETRRKCGMIMFASICFAAAVMASLIGVVVYMALRGDELLDDDSQDATFVEAPSGAPTDPGGQALLKFLVNRSFDAGSSLQEYASPQRIALRYIDAEFPGAPLDEKLIDMYAVATFFFSTSGISWKNNTKWKSGDPICIWHGIGCDDNGYVVSIELVNNRLLGTIPLEVGLLAPRQVNENMATTGVEKLDLSHNAIRGIIPEQIGLLTNMQKFNVADNSLSGNIPLEITRWRALQNASFVNNNLDGEIPDELCSTNTTMIAVDCVLMQCSCCFPDCTKISSTLPGQEIGTISTTTADGIIPTTAFDADEPDEQDNSS